MDYITLYFADCGKILQKTVEQIISKLGFPCGDINDWISIADEVFVAVVEKFKEKPDEFNFDQYLRMCLENRFKSEMTRRNREKRRGETQAASMESPVPGTDGLTVSDLIEDTGHSVEEILFPEHEELSKKTKRYIEYLTPTEKRVAMYLMEGKNLQEIKSLMGLTQKKIDRLMARMRSWEYTRILF